MKERRPQWDDELGSGAMDMPYWKATRPDGTDFYTGTVDYAAALYVCSMARGWAEL